MIHFVYIIYSPSTDRFYIGETMDLEGRVIQHQTHQYSGGFTSLADDWAIILYFECSDRSQALNIESKIKKMKSKKHIRNLIQYPDLRQKYESQFTGCKTILVE